MAFFNLLITIVCVLLRKPYMGYAFLVMQTLLGMLLFYLVVFVDISFMEWNWLLVSFNPLPALLWKWRSRWQLAYACCLFVWIVAMLVVPYPQAEYPVLILSFAICVAYISPILHCKLRLKELNV